MINLDKTIKFCLEKVDEGLKNFTYAYPHSASINNIYQKNTNTDWTNGFWTGMLWLSYEFSGDEKYKKAAMWQVEDFYDRIVKKIEVGHHDMGFLYIPSCVAGYKLTGDNVARQAALDAAEHLLGRFQENGQFIQAWGELGAEDNYRLIIDCLMNIPLLFWASAETGDEKFGAAAKAHLDTTMKVIMREDGGTHHTYYFDTKTGEPLYGVTHQGFSDNSIWARGQAWGVYGTALGYRHTKNPELIEKFKKITDVFLSHLPEDNIPAWDLIFTDTKTLKDTSAAAIAVCGILEMSRICDVPTHYIERAKDMIAALIELCLTSDIPNSNGILKHAVYSMPHNNGVDECNIWGDYYFMEALMRLKNSDWNSYWDK